MLDTHKLERRSRPPHGDARVLVTVWGVKTRPRLWVPEIRSRH
jgi:hypothetical protein